MIVSGPTVTVSLDTGSLASTPAWTSLASIAISEIAPDDLPAGQTDATLVLRAPTGWEFRPGSGQVFGSVFMGDVVSENINVTAAHITVTLTIDDVADAFDSLVIAAVDVRPTTSAPTTGTIHRPAGAEGGSALMSGIAATANADGSGGTSFASLTSVAGAPTSDLRVEPLDANSGAGSPTAALVVGSTFAVRVSAVDQFGNRSPAAGVTTVTFVSNAGSAPDGTAPTIPATVAPVFAAGVAALPDCVLTNVEAACTFSAVVTEPGTTGIPVNAAGASTAATVSPGPAGDLSIEKDGGGELGSVLALTPFAIQITARDRFGNPATSGPNNFSGPGTGVVLTSNVAAVDGLGVTPAFGDGVLAHHAVTFADPSAAATITATSADGSGTPSGQSAPFAVTGGQPPVLTVPPALTLIAETTAGTPNPDQLGQLVAFVAAASASDAVDGSAMPVANDAPSLLPVGTTAVEFSAVDGRGATAAASVDVTVISVATALSQLDERVVALELDSRRLERQLRSKLADALEYVERERLGRALRALDAFRARVRGATDPRLAPGDAAALVAAAQRIEDVLWLGR